MTETAPLLERQALSRERVVGAAVELADRDGVDAVSMRKLGEALGVDPMALYRHVRDKDDGLDGATDAVVAEIEAVEPGADWKAAMSALARAARQVMLRHPWAPRVIVERKTVGPATLQHIDRVLRILQRGGFTIEMAHHALHVLGSRMLGFTQDPFDDSDDARSEPPPPDVVARTFAAYPNVAELARQEPGSAESGHNAPPIPSYWRRTMRWRNAVLITGLVVLAFAAPAAAITNGTPDGNNHPYIGLAVFDVDGTPSHRCSASLLTPTVVLTAAHCTVGTSAARVWFDEVVQGNAEYPFSGPSSYDGQAFTHPDFCNPCAGGLPGFALHDVGVIVLSEPVPGSVVNEFAHLPSVGAVGGLGQKAILDYVGYGVNQRFVGGGPPVWGGPRVRLAATGALIAPTRFVHAPLVIKYSLNPAQGKGGICFGDSGGPDLIGGTDTVVGVNSYVTNTNCSGVGYSSRIDVASHLAWINSFLP